MQQLVQQNRDTRTSTDHSFVVVTRRQSKLVGNRAGRPGFVRTILLACVLSCSVAFGQTTAPESTPATEKPTVTSKEEPTKLSEEGESLPLLTEMPLPSMADLLTKPPVDWIVLAEAHVLVVEPFQPRPQPLETLQKRIADIDERLGRLNEEVVNNLAGEQLAQLRIAVLRGLKKDELAAATGQQVRGLTVQKIKDLSEAELAAIEVEKAGIDPSRMLDALPFQERRRLVFERGQELRQQREKAQSIQINLTDVEEVTSYEIQTRDIVAVIQHEDLMLRRIDQLLESQQADEAFEMLLVLTRREPDWPGVRERENRLLLVSAQLRLDADDPEAAFVLLEEAAGHSTQLKGLSRLFGAAAEKLIGDAAADGDYRRTRHFLSRLARSLPGHPTAAQWSQRLLSLADGHRQQADAAFTQEDYPNAATEIEQAAAIWPDLPGLPQRLRRYCDRFQRLRVGVLGFPTSAHKVSSPLMQWAHDRVARLTTVPLFEVSRVDKAAHYRSRFLESWEPQNLGRRVLLFSRLEREPWEAVPSVDAYAIANAFRSRLDSAAPNGNERLAAFIKAVVVDSPTRAVIELETVPSRLQPLMSLASTSPAAAMASRANGIAPRFVEFDRDAETVVYRRAVPQTGTLGPFSIAEVTERKYPTEEDAVQGLLRGEIDLLDRVDPATARALADSQDFHVVKYALPTTHLVQFHPQSKLLEMPELRRALALGIDRERILAEVALAGANPAGGRLTSGPFRQGSDAANALVPLPEYQPILALALKLAAEQQSQGKLPPLRMEAIIAGWKRLGLDVALWPHGSTALSQEVSADAGADANSDDRSPPWDVIYRDVCLQEPGAEIWPMLTLESDARVESLDHFPAWLRNELLELEASSSWQDEQRSLHVLHRDLTAEAFVIPLWELERHLVARREVKGIPTPPLSTYEGIERWTLQPWYPVEVLTQR